MKKYIAILLAVLMVVALCAGCGDSATDEPTDEPTADASEPTGDADVPDDAAEPPADKGDGAPPSDDKADGAPSGEGESETGQAQTLEQFSNAGYDKTWDGYIQYCIDAQNADEGAPDDIKAQNVESLQAATEDTYDPTGQPFGMMIEFGLVMTYEDFLK